MNCYQLKDSVSLCPLATTTQWAGASKLWKKLDSSAKHLRMEVVEGLLEAHRQSESDDIKKSKIYAKSGIWDQISLFGHGGLHIQNLPFSQFG